MEKDLNLIEFFKKYPTETEATKFFEALRWSDGIVCPYCCSKHISSCKVPMPYRCRDCRKHFSVRIGTILNESKLPLQTWLLAIYVLTTSKKGISSIQLSNILGVTQKTAWFLAHRIRTTWLQSNDKLTGMVEVDEVYIGGKEKNKHYDKKIKSGRGAVGKKPVIGLKSRQGQVKGFVVDSTNTKTLTTNINNNVEDGSIIYTDDFKAYKNLQFDHAKTCHSAGEYVKGNVHTNSIESFWAVLKRGYYGIYRYWSPKHLQRYIDEFTTRHNLLECSNYEKICYTILSGLDKRITYKELINA